MDNGETIELPSKLDKVKARLITIKNELNGILSDVIGDFNVHKFFDDEERREKYKKWYLFSYNFTQALGWTFILLQFIRYTISTPDVLKYTLYDEVQYTLTLFQTAAFLEILHAYLQLTSSNPRVTLQQIYSRLFMVVGVLLLVEGSRKTVGFKCVLLAWSVTEIIRYSNYALGIFNAAPWILVWLRYTTFIFLYPIGVSGEVMCMYSAVQDVIRTRQWCLEFPNEWNMMFQYHYYILFNMLLYIPFFPKLYMHMFALRSKFLGKETPKKIE